LACAACKSTSRFFSHERAGYTNNEHPGGNGVKIGKSLGEMRIGQAGSVTANPLYEFPSCLRSAFREEAARAAQPRDLQTAFKWLLSMSIRTRLFWMATILAVLALQGRPASAQFETGYDAPASEYALPIWRVRTDYLLLWTNGNQLPPLVTTSPIGTPRAEAGVLGTPGAGILFGGEAIDTGARSGGRISVSRWFEEADDTCVEFTGFYVGDDGPSGDFVRASGGSPILSRPFLNVDSNQEDAELVSFPNVISGRVAVATYSDLYSGAASIRHNLGRGPLGNLHVLGGYRYFKLREDLAVRENLTNIDPGGLIPQGTTTDLIDRFSTRTDFHGGEFGLVAEFFSPMVTVELVTKVALGSVFRKATISGETTVIVPGNAPTTTPGGLLALPTNIGSHAESGFGVLPELGLNTAIAITPNLSFVCGYTLIILNDVLRTGDQIDRVINTSQIGGDPLVGQPRPAFDFQASHLVLQGLSLGIEYSW
jgi:hypothetical protein